MVVLGPSRSAPVFSRVSYHTPSDLQADVNIRLLCREEVGIMNIKIMNRKEIRLRTENADEYIRLTISAQLAVLRSVSVCDLVRCRKKGVATVVIIRGVI